jgi:hypothetical protein
MVDQFFAIEIAVGHRHSWPPFSTVASDRSPRPAALRGLARAISAASPSSGGPALFPGAAFRRARLGARDLRGLALFRRRRIPPCAAWRARSPLTTPLPPTHPSARGRRGGGGRLSSPGAHGTCPAPPTTSRAIANVGLGGGAHASPRPSARWARSMRSQARQAPRRHVAPIARAGSQFAHHSLVTSKPAPKPLHTSATRCDSPAPRSR